MFKQFHDFDKANWIFPINLEITYMIKLSFIKISKYSLISLKSLFYFIDMNHIKSNENH
jgi:hypothetical protein